MIAPPLKGRVRGAQDREVPFEQVVLHARQAQCRRSFLRCVLCPLTTLVPAGHRTCRPKKQAEVTRLTSSGLALYCGVGSLSSLASFSRRLTAVGGRVSH